MNIQHTTMTNRDLLTSQFFHESVMELVDGLNQRDGSTGTTSLVFLIDEPEHQDGVNVYHVRNSATQRSLTMTFFDDEESGRIAVRFNHSIRYNLVDVFPYVYPNDNNIYIKMQNIDTPVHFVDTFNKTLILDGTGYREDGNAFSKRARRIMRGILEDRLEDDLLACFTGSKKNLKLRYIHIGENDIHPLMLDILKVVDAGMTFSGQRFYVETTEHGDYCFYNLKTGVKQIVHQPVDIKNATLKTHPAFIQLLDNVVSYLMGEGVCFKPNGGGYNVYPANNYLYRHSRRYRRFLDYRGDLLRGFNIKSHYLMCYKLLEARGVLDKLGCRSIKDAPTLLIDAPFYQRIQDMVMDVDRLDKQVERLVYSLQQLKEACQTESLDYPTMPDDNLGFTTVDYMLSKFIEGYKHFFTDKTYLTNVNGRLRGSDVMKWDLKLKSNPEEVVATFILSFTETLEPIVKYTPYLGNRSLGEVVLPKTQFIDFITGLINREDISDGFFSKKPCKLSNDEGLDTTSEGFMYPIPMNDGSIGLYFSTKFNEHFYRYKTVTVTFDVPPSY